jgi:lipoprotein-anchoring transpeptidase ErfK/SrfK
MVADSDHLIKAARRAIEQNRPHDGRSLLQQAARRNPNDPRIWLLLAGLASSPRAREAYLERAADLRRSNPAAATAIPAIADTPTPATSPVLRRGRSALPAGGGGLLVFLLAVLFVLAGLFFWSYLAGRPAEALVTGWLPGTSLSQTMNSTPAEAPEPATAARDVAPRTEATGQEELANTLQPTPTLASVTVQASPPAVKPSAVASPEIVAVAEVDDSLAKQIAPDSQPRAAWTPTLAPTPTPEPTATPAPAAEPAVAGATARPAGVSANERWVDVNLSTQTLIAFEGDTPVLSSLISSGTSLHPTVTGQYRTYTKYESQTMNGYLLGYDYYLEGVPYVMYFYRDYAIHGTYWHNNFGTPMSHGCVNMNTADAGWLYNWAPLGTVVNVHY